MRRRLVAVLPTFGSHGSIIVDTVKSGAQWPRASVIGIVMMLAIGVMLMLAQRLSKRRVGA